MSDLANAPWKAVYPAGLVPDATLATWPVHEMVDRSGLEWGVRHAFVFRGRDFSYLDLQREVDAFAARLVAAGMAKGDPTRILAQGETDELRIAGPNVTAGYWNCAMRCRARRWKALETRIEAASGYGHRRRRTS